MVGIRRTGDAEIEVEGRRIALRQLDRPMWPVAELTKADLVDYYARIAPVMLPHVADRPLRAVRFPDGVHLRGVVDSDLPPVTDTASLLELADLAAVELHVPLGPPASVLFELEPGVGCGREDCCRVALRLRDVLAEAGLRAWVKTSGVFGLHVAVPLNGGADEAAARQYARATAERLAGEDPGAVTADGRRTSRAGRVLLDWRPNAPVRASVAPYSLRAMLPGPGVSAPVRWEDVQAGTLERSPRDVLAAVGDGADPWRAVLETVQSLP